MLYAFRLQQPNRLIHYRLGYHYRAFTVCGPLRYGPINHASANANDSAAGGWIRRFYAREGDSFILCGPGPQRSEI